MSALEKTQQEIKAREEILRSGNAALCFSSGKDSLACLLLLRPYLDSVHVLFVNTGRQYPETLEIAEGAKAVCPKWAEIKTDRAAQWKANGLPSDLVPIDWTGLGQALCGAKPVRVQSYLQCCWENISAPLVKKAKELGVTLFIRGQRNQEERKSPARTGTFSDGLLYWHPIEGWSKTEVLDYIGAELGEIPAHYAIEHSSLDCFDCTAFTKNSLDRARYTKERHPELYREYFAAMSEVYGAMREQIGHYEAILEARSDAKGH